MNNIVLFDYDCFQITFVHRRGGLYPLLIVLAKIPSCLPLLGFLAVSLAKDSYRNGRITPPLILENLEPVEIIKKLFQHHLNILKNI